MSSKSASSIKCFYTNATSLNNKLDFLRAEIAAEKPQIISITETWFTQDSVTNINGYQLYRSDRRVRKCGVVALYIDSNLKSCIAHEDVFKSNDDFEQVWVKLEIGSTRSLVGCIN